MRYPDLAYMNTVFIDDRALAPTNTHQCHRALLRMLRYVDYVCTYMNLSYWMCGGTLLGAIVHRGFVPTSGDIDIAMNRSDYYQLYTVLSAFLLDGLSLELYDSSSSLIDKGDIFSSAFFRIVDNRGYYLEGDFSGQGLGLDVHCNDISCSSDFIYYSITIDGEEEFRFLYSILYPLRLYKFERYVFWGPCDPVGFLRIFNFSARIGYDDYLEHIDYYLCLRSLYDQGKEITSKSFMLSGV